MLDEVLGFLAPQKGDSYLDLTAGYGGHAQAVLERTLKPSKATLVDRDQDAIRYLERHFGGARIIHQDFLGASQRLLDFGEKFNLILADLGVSSPHLENAGRGFSFDKDGPLDMRMDLSQDLTAEVIVNTFSQKELSKIIQEYGEEPKASKIAKAIVINRPFKTTKQLAKIIARFSSGHSKIHPATRSFQALRIAVNNELEQLKIAIPIWIDLLTPGGRIVVISFHSLEDRIVKQTLNENSGDHYDACLKLLTRQPRMASADEKVSNPRARSAKLRAAVKINTTERGVAHANSG